MRWRSGDTGWLEVSMTVLLFERGQLPQFTTSTHVTCLRKLHTLENGLPRQRFRPLAH